MAQLAVRTALAVQLRQFFLERRGRCGDVGNRRAESALYITSLLAFMMLTVGSSLAVHFEHSAKGANITTGANAFWWAYVTITTVGYGDFYPVTTLGRMTGVFVMFAGIGIIGALASILASLLVSPSTPDSPAPGAASTTAPADASGRDAIVAELAGLRSEMAGQRAEIAALRASLDNGKT
mgnify:CR=1 FL=1